ncbi:hypothetical protein [Fuerstiella marisgermanici]|uniref:DUF4190 domain-containing protein n=1 Tax=Fuerstiella marisgermanici TaxID=1891926 RepID=A0A1P8WMZ8_9PLAN|nr:hypothetical protein [Fuerstiella marisgermanici]APZ95407.1 hypothetical protein Fuma_05065 [Fuerstiella marisgermanici]
MSSTMLTDDIAKTELKTENSAWAKPAEFDEFDYVPVSPWGPVAIVLGIASLTGFTNSVFGLVIAAMGVVIGISAVFRVRAAAGAAKGTWMAVVGTLASVLCLTFGSMKLVNAYETECPPGFKRVNFPNEISAHEFVYYGGLRRLHPKVAPLIGEKVFLKGFMWQTQRSEGLTEFVFLKDNGECCFGGDPKPYDMMVVKMVDGQTTDAYTGMVAVAGVLNANVRAAEGEPVYTVDATMVEEARTSF